MQRFRVDYGRARLALGVVCSAATVGAAVVCGLGSQLGPLPSLLVFLLILVPAALVAAQHLLDRGSGLRLHLEERGRLVVLHYPEAGAVCPGSIEVHGLRSVDDGSAMVAHIRLPGVRRLRIRLDPGRDPDAAAICELFSHPQRHPRLAGYRDRVADARLRG